MDIFARDLAGEKISVQDPEYNKIKEVIIETQKKLAELNLSYHSREEVREIFSDLTGQI